MFIRFADTVLRHARAFLLIVACVTGLVVAGLHATAPEESLLETTRDVVAQRQTSGQLVLVQLDAKSIEHIHAWPWPRSVHGRLVDILNAAGARRIAFDVDFTSAAADPHQDEIFAASIARTNGRVVLPGTLELSDAGSHNYISALPTRLLAEHAHIANILIAFEKNGQVRSYNYGYAIAGQLAPSLPVYLSGIAATPRQGKFNIDWSFDPGSIPTVSYSDVLEGKIPPSFFRGRTVLVGGTASTVGDRYPVPVYGIIPGVYINAIAGETLRKGMPRAVGQLPMLGLALLVIATTAFARTGSRRMQLLVAGLVAVLGIPLALKIWSPVTIESVAALMTIVAGISAQCWLWITGLVVRRITLASGSSLPNLLAMTIQPQPRGLSVAIRLRNHVETTALLGHAAQAELLCRIHERLEYATQGARIYQIDERSFAWRTNLDIAKMSDIIEGLHSIFAAGIPIGGARKQTIDTTISVGLCDQNELDLEESVAAAMLAADQAAQQGVHWLTYEPYGTDADWRLTLLGEVDRAIVNEDLWIAYQPKIDLRSGRITGAEALVRWTHPERGFIAPDRFIPIIEENGRIDRLTFFVLEHAVRDFAPLGDLKIAVNLSMRLLGRTPLVDAVREVLDRYAMPAHRLTLEITESANMAGDEGLAELERLRALGVAISIDDYGTGQSTLSYLQKLPATELKIDRSFVQLILTSRSGWAVVDSTIKLAHALGLSVVAEGVETQEIMDALTRMECDEQQGYLTGRPVPIHDFVANLGTDSSRRKTVGRAA